MFSLRPAFTFLKGPKTIFSLISIAAFVLIIRIAPAPKLTYDSYDYINSSENAFTYIYGSNPDHHSYLYHPPALPFFLHLFSNKILAAKWLNAICYILSLWLCYFISKEFNLEKTFQVSLVSIVAFSFPWLQNHFFLWTEPAFATGLLLITWMLISKKNWMWILVACALLFFIRKAGVFIATGIIIVYILDQKYKVAVTSAVVLFLLFLSWESVTFYFAKRSLSQNIFSDLVNQSRWFYADAVSAWFLPRNINLIVRLCILILMAVVPFIYLKQKLLEFFAQRSVRIVLVLVATYFLFFILFLGAAELSEADRYLSPMLPLIMLLLVTVIQFVSFQICKKVKYVIVPLILWILYPIGRTFYHLF
jgi:hypothetical protein